MRAPYFGLIILLSPLFVSQALANDLAGANSSRQVVTGLVGDLTCSKDQNYFQTELNNLASSKNKTISGFLLRMRPMEEPIMDYRCVESSLAQVRAGGVNKKGRFVGNDFNRCYVNGQGKLTLLERQKEPCATTHYSKLTHHSYELVMNCLKGYVAGTSDASIQNDWAETYFKFLTKESGLHVNVVSSTDAIGAGQLTTGYVVDFVRTSLDDVRAHLQKSSKPWCRTLGADMLSDGRIAEINYTQYLDPKTGDWKNRKFTSAKQAHALAMRSKCQMIDMLKGEPLTNLIISFAHLKKYKEQVTAILKRKPDIFKNLSSKEKAYLQRQLTTLSYNTGVGGLTPALVRTMGMYSKEKPVTNVKQFLGHVSYALGRTKNVDPDRADEMSKYLSRIEDRYEEVVKNAGLSSCRVAK